MLSGEGHAHSSYQSSSSAADASLGQTHSAGLRCPVWSHAIGLEILEGCLRQPSWVHRVAVQPELLLAGVEVTLLQGNLTRQRFFVLAEISSLLLVTLEPLLTFVTPAFAGLRPLLRKLLVASILRSSGSCWI